MNTIVVEEKTKISVLIVDNNPHMLSVLSETLNIADYQSTTASSIAEVEGLLANTDTPDLAIVNLYFPANNGFLLAEQLRSVYAIPYIAMAEDSAAAAAQKAAEYGALAYLVTPFAKHQLLTAIETAIGVSKQLRQLHTICEQLQIALSTEREINISIGITMMHHKIDRQQAFDLLRRTARSQRRKLAELAPEIIKASEHLNLDQAISIFPLKKSQ